jgi:hypothetical protein
VPPAHRPGHRLAGLAAAALLLSACSGGSAGGGPATVKLAGVCPDPVVVQTDWFPGPEVGALYQLIGPEGTAGDGRYSGPLGETGVRLEIRAGGPALGGETVASTLYGDDSILLGTVQTDDAIRDSLDLPTVAVAALWDKSPRILMWDPAQLDAADLAGVGRSTARVVYAEGSDDVDVLVGKRLLRPEQLDPSFDGSPVAFTTEQGVVQESLITGDPFTYERELAEWRKPVKFALVDDSGFRPYPSLVVRADKLDTAAACLEKLVPLVQRATVDYLADPAAVNAKLPEISRQFADFRPVSAAAAADAVAKLRAHQIASNGTNDTVGDFDEARVGTVIADAVPAFKAAEPEPGVETIKPGLSPADLVTNRFVDEGIRLPAP